MQREEKLRELVEFLLRENQKLNLTAVREPGAAWAKHILDSLQGLSTGLFDTPEGTNLSVIDVGAGAGFPGLPLAIERPQLRLTSLDATRKKCVFIESAMREMGIEGAVLNMRAEVAGQDRKLRAQFDASVCRAVGSLAEVAELCLPLVRVGGHVVLWRGENAPQEAKDARQVLGKLGGRVQDVRAYTLPEHDTRYHLTIIEKAKSTPGGFPRRDGLPKSKPLS
jgi:16S rRNA (guanine527-N7)-methyltransferase